MNAVKRFKDGLNVGLYSFSLLSKHKQLILYLSIPKIIRMILALTKHSLFFASPIRATLFLRSMINSFLYTFDGMRDVVILIFEVVTILVTIFASVALTIHTYALLKRRKAGIKRSLKEAGKKIKPILWWTLISIGVYFLLGKVDQFAYPNPCNPCDSNALLASIGILAHLTWLIAFLFVVTLIAVEDQPLKKSIVKSFTMLKTLIWNYLGAMFWVGLVGFLSLGLIWLANQTKLPISGITPFFLLIVGFVIATAHAIVKTVLYEKYGT